MSNARPFAVYVAAASTDGEIHRAKYMVAVLRAAGIRVTSTWLDVVEQHGTNPRDASHLDRRAWSLKDLEEIESADAVWFLAPPPGVTTRGGWFEIGYGYALDKHVVSSGDTKQSIFTALGHERERDLDAHRLLLELAAPMIPMAGVGEP